MNLSRALPPPLAVYRWLVRRLKARRSAKVMPGWQRWLGTSSMAAALDHSSFDDVIATLRTANPFPGLSEPAAIKSKLSEESKKRIMARADAALSRTVDFLGSGPHTLTTPIDWTCDFKSNTRWAMRASHRLPVNDLDKPSDIKVVWELSRLQWLLPVGQAYILSDDEKFADFARVIIEEWVASNPVCAGPNWICAMDVALRAISMVWLAQACKNSTAWRQADFQERLIKSLILHGKFIEGNLEYADVNGNHLIADLAGWAVIGIALGGRGIARKWVEKSWKLLSAEFPRQVPDDGVCREGSLPYHRLVAELFLLPALARQNVGLPVDNDYIKRLMSMGTFSDTATQPDGEVPLWGDADDGRALPLGTQAMNDHRYLGEMMRALSRTPASPAHDETIWWHGQGSAEAVTVSPPQSSAFSDAGAYIMRGNDAFVFVDAGPVGMAGRGGHGHNDCLSFTASLNGVSLIVDPGCYAYTQDWKARNHFRSTLAHNTPCIDNTEINRFSPKQLWRLSDDAAPDIRHWSTSAEMDILVAGHSGYQRLASPVTPVRGFMLERSTRRLFVADGFEGSGEHTVTIPYTFAPETRIEQISEGTWRIERQGQCFLLAISAPDTWTAATGITEYSPSYGVRQPAPSLTFSRTGSLKPLALAVMAEAESPPDTVRWLGSVLQGRFPVPGFKD
ncbi:alginate lyase family protein [Thalassospiraceae bacterium LMO-JJ14]|nr:alginate lyase family protein [Thalassospiraceae bacterium LMO-JJ14]